MVEKIKPLRIYLVIDESGSMAGLRQETISSFNKFVQEQSVIKDGRPARLFVTLFDSMHLRKPIWDVPIKDVKLWTDEDYIPGALTPLLDAVGSTLSDTKGKGHLAVIITDGYENASHEWTKEQVKDLITQKEKAGWKVLYFGANVDAFAEAGNLGIAGQTVSGFQPTGQSLGATYSTASSSSTAMRTGQSFNVVTNASGDPGIQIVKSRKKKPNTTSVTP